MSMWKWMLAALLIPSIVLGQGVFPNSIGGKRPGFFSGNASAPTPPPTSPFALIAHARNNGSSTTSTTSAIDTSTANLCIVSISWAISATPATCAGNVSDSKSNTWKTATTTSGNIAASAICYASPCTTGSGHTFTFSGTNLFGSFDAAAFKGSGGTSSLAVYEASNLTSTGSSVTTQKPGYVSAEQNFMLSVAALSTASQSTIAIDSSFVITDSLASDGVFLGGSLAYLIQGTATSTNPQWTTGTSAIAAATQAIFISSATAPAVTFAGGYCDSLSGSCGECWDITMACVSAYNGPLFQLAKVSSPGTTLDIGQTSHVADMSTWAAFCDGGVVTGCKVSKIYAQIHGHGNDLIPSNLNALLGPDCRVATVGVNGCAAIFAIETATGLPILTLTAPQEYTLAADAAVTGMTGGNHATTALYNGKPLNDSSLCCGSWGMGHFFSNPNDPGTNFLVGTSFGTTLFAGFCSTPTSFCITVDLEGATPPFGDYSAFRISNSFIAMGTYNPTGTAAATFVNNHAIATSTPAGMSIGTSVHFGGGGDLSQPASIVWRGGLVADYVFTAGDRAAIQTIANNFYTGLVFP